mgnify:FL=1
MNLNGQYGKAACAGIDTDMFYEDDVRTPNSHITRTFREMCSGCEILADCGEWAIKHERWGFWAGMTPADRDKIRKKRNIIVDDPSDGLQPRFDNSGTHTGYGRNNA